MPDLRGTRTHDFLRASFLRDALLVQLLNEFSLMSSIEGYPHVARTLKELAETEGTLAAGSLDFLRPVGEPIGDAPVDGTRMLLRALKGILAVELNEELAERAKTARAEGFYDIASWFESIALTRSLHLARLDAVLAQLGEER
jgi:rubrerythrin